MMIVASIFILILFLYTWVILFFTGGWLKMARQNVMNGDVRIRVSVIIAARNEEQAILPCLLDIAAQDYPRELIEVIVVDDDSTDNTNRVVNDFIRPGSMGDIHIHLLKTDGRGNGSKKQAIAYGISRSSGDLIITTDADTRRGSRWISAIAGFYGRYRPKMILGPVAFHHESSIFMQFQSVEFLGLMGATAGSCGAGVPVLCNGANLAYERTAFLESGGFDNNLGFASGDDIFLMLRFRKRYGTGAIRYLGSREAIVATDAKPTLHEFLRQRIRWVSKSKGYKDAWLIFVSIITYLASFEFIPGIVIGIFFPRFFLFLIALFLVKSLAELPLVWMTARFFGKTRYLAWFPVVQVLNIIYVSVIGALGNVLPYRWKGRIVSGRGSGGA
jgi:cellulose synthase/poly-beta-1,6-N-acetylglucosamine synthase-like glycosyltransferase